MMLQREIWDAHIGCWGVVIFLVVIFSVLIYGGFIR